jgi:hypothetical protein
MNLPFPFAYPEEPHRHRHGPVDYGKPGDYREWVRDEWAFRCVYCLRRERWMPGSRFWEVDHILPRKGHEELVLDYNNLTYACRCCNGTKLKKIVPNPCKKAYAKLVWVDEGGYIHHRNKQGKKLIEALGLDGGEPTEMRMDILQRIQAAKKLPPNDPDRKAMLDRCLGYPPREMLPDLVNHKPKPKHNARPDGVHQSHRARKDRGELPDYY